MLHFFFFFFFQGDDDEKPTPTGGVSRSLFPEFVGKDSHISNASHSSDMSSEDEQRLREEVNNLRKQIIELTERPALEFPLKSSPEEEEKEQKEKQPDEKLSDSNTQKLLQKSQLVMLFPTYILYVPFLKYD